MSITIEELAARLNAEAARRGITVDVLIDELAERVVEPEERSAEQCHARGSTATSARPGLTGG